MNTKRKPQYGVPLITSALIESKQTVRVDLDRQQYLAGLIIKFSGRLTTAGGAGASVNAEAPFSLLNRIRVTMNHSLFGSKLPVNLSGATVYRRAHIISGTAPVASGSLATANAAYDIEVDWPVMFFLEKSPSQSVLASLLSAPLCSQLTLEMDFNNGAALIPTGGATTYAWSQYGSAAGNPELDVTLLQVNGLTVNPKTVLVTKTDQLTDLTQGVGQDQQVGNELPIGYTVARIWLKQYVKDALASAYVAATMNSPKVTSAAGFVSPQIQIDRVAIRQYNKWSQLESENKNHWQLQTWPAGYGVIDFLEGSHYGSPVGSVSDLLLTQSIAVKKGTLTVSGQNNALANGELEVGVDQLFPIPAQAKA